MTEMEKVYDPAQVEGRIYEQWQQGGYFHAEPDPTKKPFCIVIPPPNVTGALHIGHALDNTLQDILVRYRRMQGYATLWLPGTDHAGIATQNVVERELRKEGLTRHDLGREKFVERVWAWKKIYGGKIIEQLKRLGSSCDWSRERFTMDEGLSGAVRKVFVDLYNEGLIYRGKRIINWCPRCETALSDVEVRHEDHVGELVRFRYPLESGGHVMVATTRLETMLGDTAIAVNPDDERYKELIGAYVTHPFFDRRLRIEPDQVVDPAFGTGAVKVTPAHDATDFEMGERHYLQKINIFDSKAAINEEGGSFAGQDRYEARESIRKALDEKGLLEGSEPHEYSIGVCDRCGTVVEPWLSEQWFVRMQPLAEPAIAAVKDGRTKFHPDRWTNFYLNWMEGIRDWCISRQLWWGHRIPVWYCDCGFHWAAIEDPSICPECEATTGFHQDPDVLDTWFSSQLWPFSTLGWPEKTPELDYFYPTSVIVPGYEIIHLWVSRMMMAGLYFMKDVPFRHAFIHGIVRDADGAKMSKSLGNVVDPLDLIDRYGTDALRFTLADHATGQDIFLHTEWIEGARNFANKLWNASRFILGTEVKAADSQPPPLLPEAGRLTLADRWILSRLNQTAATVSANFEAFEMAPAAKALFEFTRNDLCDWYIEAAKLRLYGDDEQTKADVKNVLVWVLEATLRLLHPIMPFITEEIWSFLPSYQAGASIMVAPWPETDATLADPIAESQFVAIQKIVSEIRSFRSKYAVSPKKEIDAHFAAADAAVLSDVEGNGQIIRSLAGLGELTFGRPGDEPGESKDHENAHLVAGAVDIFIPMAGLVDLDAERDRLGKTIAKALEEMGRISSKLGNEKFKSKAPAGVVAEQQRRLDEETERHDKLVSRLKALGQ
ncbi:MAG: valine--tRNA ligase [Actinomycetota bacterium]